MIQLNFVKSYYHDFIFISFEQLNPDQINKQVDILINSLKVLDHLNQNRNLIVIKMKYRAKKMNFSLNIFGLDFSILRQFDIYKKNFNFSCEL